MFDKLFIKKRTVEERTEEENDKQEDKQYQQGLEGTRAATTTQLMMMVRQTWRKTA